MWGRFSWTKLQDPEIITLVEDLRHETVQRLIRLTLVGFILWHFASLLVDGHHADATENTIRHWTLFPFIVLGFLAIQRYSMRRESFVSVAFLMYGVLSITLAIYILHAPGASLLYPLVALAAVVLLHPMAGCLISALSSGMLFLLWQIGPLAFMGSGRIVETAAASLLAVVVAWTLGRNMLIAVEWSLESYTQARNNAEDARTQRARLVQALKQLDTAYYRLQQANAALEFAWKAAEAAEQAKTEFVTNISHELRTPLNLIAGFSEMILTAPESYPDPLPASFRGDLNAIYRSTQHLLMLTTDVIDLALVGAGRLALSREPVDLEQTIRDACDIVREFVETKGLVLTINVPSPLPLLSVDRLRVRQVLLNLMTNAARFTPHGSITITAIHEGDRILVRVSDTGKGIAPDDLGKVFDEFYHGSDSDVPSTQSLGGFGLGLPLSKRFIELHAGQMGVESEIGRGTTFWFTLPVLADVGSANGESRKPLRLAAHAGTDERILVLVGMDRWLAQFLQQHLRGYRIVPAPDLRSAIALAEEFHAVAILQDNVADPTVDGIDCTVPVFQVPLPQTDRLAAALGVDAYLVKPVSRSQLREAIGQLNRPVQRILVVDDDDRFVRLLGRMLRVSARDPSYEIRTAPNGRDAMEQLTANRPDLVLLDLMMPVLGGSELIAEIRRTASLADIPIIIISGQDQVDHRLTLFGPVAVHQSTGFHLEELLGTIEALLGAMRLRSREQPAGSAAPV